VPGTFTTLLCEFGAKIERAESSLRPDHIVGNHPVASAAVAGLAGFMVGSAFDNRGAGGVMIAAVLGCALLIRSAREAGGGYGGRPSYTD
jgi:hypothetical protein